MRLQKEEKKRHPFRKTIVESQRKEVSVMYDDTLCQGNATSLENWKPSQEEIVEVVSKTVSVFEEQQPGRLGRPPEVSVMHVCLGLVIAVVRQGVSQLDVWRLICSETLGSFAPKRVSDQTIYNHLSDCAEMMRTLFLRVSEGLRAEQKGWQDRRLAPFATEVLALDESTLDQVKRWLSSLTVFKKGSKALLAGRISALFDLRLQQWVQIDLLDEAVADSREHARQMIASLKAGCMLLFDRGYCGFLWFDELTRRGIWWASRLPSPVTYELRHVLYQGDGIIDAIILLGRYRSDQALFPVRLVQFWWHGKRYRYITNVLDPQVLPLHELARLYARRWDIEMAFRLLKDYFSGYDLWSAKWSTIQAQLWALCLLAQVLHTWQGRIARCAGVDRFDVSLELVVRYTPDLLRQRIDPVPYFVRHGRDLGIIRPSTRSHVHSPIVPPEWISMAPAEAYQPREKARHSPYKVTPHKYRKTGACSSACVSHP
jgi:hypothetical protein